MNRNKFAKSTTQFCKFGRIFFVKKFLEKVDKSGMNIQKDEYKFVEPTTKFK